MKEPDLVLAEALYGFGQKPCIVFIPNRASSPARFEDSCYIVRMVLETDAQDMKADVLWTTRFSTPNSVKNVWGFLQRLAVEPDILAHLLWYNEKQRSSGSPERKVMDDLCLVDPFKYATFFPRRYLMGVCVLLSRGFHLSGRGGEDVVEDQWLTWCCVF